MTLKMVRLPKMKLRRLQFAAHFATLACCSLVCVMSGCGKSEAPAPAASQEKWSEDPAFKKAMNENHAQAMEIGKRRVPVTKRMNEMKAIMKEKLATDDEKKVEEELEKNAEWRSLKEKRAAIDAEFEKKRQEMLVQVRQQMNKGNLSK